MNRSTSSKINLLVGTALVGALGALTTAACCWLLASPEVPRFELPAISDATRTVVDADQVPVRTPARSEDALAEVAPIEAGPAASQDPVPAAGQVRRRLAGKVVDLLGNPVAGVELMLNGDTPTTVSSAPDGHFEALGAPGSKWRLTEQSRHVLVSSVQHRDSEALMVISSENHCGGRVVDEHGVGIAGALVNVRYPAGKMLAAIGHGPGFALHPTRETTDGSGGFHMQTGEVEGLTLSVEAEGYQSLSLPLEGEDTSLVLTLTSSRSVQLEGRVVDAEYSGVAGVDVRVGSRRCKSGPDGQFAMDLDPVDPSAELVAASPGLGVARLQPLADLQPSQDRILLGDVVLEDTGNALEGALVDDKGNPLAGWLVIARPVEGASAQTRAAMLALARSTTDEQGRFKLMGTLDAASVSLWFASKPANLECTSTGHQFGQRDVVVKVATSEHPTTFSGTIVNQDGQPVPGAWVRLDRIASQAGSPASPSPYSSPRVQADENGQFSFQALAGVPATLEVLGASIGRKQFTISSAQGRELRVDQIRS